MEVRKAIDIASSEIEATGTAWHQRFRPTAFGYFEDMHQSFLRQYDLLKPGGQSVCIIANSAHGSGSHRIPIATDICLATLASDVGFDVENILIARQMRRRDTLNLYLRESVIKLRKPNYV